MDKLNLDLREAYVTYIGLAMIEQFPDRELVYIHELQEHINEITSFNRTLPTVHE